MGRGVSIGPCGAPTRLAARAQSTRADLPLEGGGDRSGLLGISRGTLECRKCSSSILAEPVEQDLIVGPLHDMDLLGHSPGQGLLMQRNV